MQNTQPPQIDAFVEGVQISTRKIKIKKYINKTVFLYMSYRGIRGLYNTIFHIFVTYPKISLYYQELNYDESAHIQILTKAAVVAISSFIEVAFGLGMVIKKSTAVKTIHTIIGLGIIFLSLYLNKIGALPDLEAIEKVALLLST